MKTDERGRRKAARTSREEENAGKLLEMNTHKLTHILTERKTTTHIYVDLFSILYFNCWHIVITQYIAII